MLRGLIWWGVIAVCAFNDLLVVAAVLVLSYFVFEGFLHHAEGQARADQLREAHARQAAAQAELAREAQQEVAAAIREAAEQANELKFETPEDESNYNEMMAAKAFAKS